MLGLPVVLVAGIWHELCFTKPSQRMVHEYIRTLNIELAYNHIYITVEYE